MGVTHILACMSAALLMLTVSLTQAGETQADKAHQPGPKITIDLEDVSLSDALEAIFQQIHIRYSVQPELQTLFVSERRTVHARQLSLDELLHSLLPDPFTPNRPYRKQQIQDYYRFDITGYDLQLKDVSADKAITEFFLQAGHDFIIREDTLTGKNVSLSLKNLTMEEGFQAVTRATGIPLQIVRRNGIYGVQSKSVEGSNRNTIQPQVTLALNRVEVNTAIAALYDACGLHRVKRTYPKGIVRLGLLHVPFDLALKEILQKAQPNHDQHSWPPYKATLRSNTTSQKRLSLNVRKVSTAEALSQLFDAAGCDYAFAWSVVGSQPITLSVSQVSLEEGFAALMEKARPPGPLKLVSHQGIYLVVPREPGKMLCDLEATPMSFKLRHREMSEALWALCDAEEVSFVDQMLPTGSVTLSMQNSPLSSAVMQILDQGNPHAGLLVNPSLIWTIPWPYKAIAPH